MEHVLWCEKYRPNKVKDVILPDVIKKDFQDYVDKGLIDTNLLLTGGPGMGKTTIAKAMLKELDADYLFINASINGNIDTLRYDVQQFASTMSFDGNRKYIIFDEADKLTAGAQDGLRGFIEEFAKTCGFIFTCNNPASIKEPIKSRSSMIEFVIPKNEKADLLKTFFKRVEGILKNEEITYDKKVAADIIIKNFPDFRKTLNILQKAAGSSKSINEEDFIDQLNKEFDNLIDALRKKNFDKVRTWVAENSDIQPSDLYRRLYDNASSLLLRPSIPLLILNIAKYQYQHSFVADPEINTMAFLVEVMADCEWIGK